MKREEKMGSPRLIRRRAHGQSIPLIALMIVVIVAMVGLSVDVGNTFARERQIVAAANAASVAGMNAYLDSTAPSTATVYDAINNTLRANGVNPDDSSLTITRTYLDYKAEPIAGESEIIDDPREAPDNVAYVTVNIRGTVDTYFARVVNRDTLPVNTQTYAGTCPAGAGIYPIAIWSGYIRDNDFIDPLYSGQGLDPDWRVISGGEYDGRTARRVYLKENSGQPGGFSWLQWDPEQSGGSGNAGNLAEALAGFGNLTGGFEEDEWPEGYPNKPNPYPEKPGEINAGDWVSGNTGLSNSSAVNNALEGHIQNGTKMILPIFDENTGNGTSGSYHIARLGLFVLLNYDQEQGKKYFDLVFLGDAVRQRTACVVSLPPPPPSQPLTGNVAFMPAYPSDNSEYQPVQYVVVLDVSGSMNMTFEGIGTNNSGQNVQCTNGPNGEPHGNCGEPNFAYHDKTLRRIYVAKEGLKMFVRETNMVGNPGYNPALPQDRVAMVWFNHTAPANWKVDFTNNPGALETAISQAGRAQGDEYKTQGGTNGAAGLFRAAQLFQAAPKITNEVGQEWEYKRVVLFITDGVSNYFMDDNSNGNMNAGQSTASTFPAGSYCRSLGVYVVENADCQTTDVGGVYNGKDRPVTQMINVADDLIKNNPAVGLETTIAVLALSNIPSTGLENSVATTGSFYAAPNLGEDAQGNTAVDRALLDIEEEPNGSPCQQLTNDWKDTLFADQFTPIGGFSYPSKIGQVTLSNSVNGVEQSADIFVDSDGKMKFEFDELPNGTYQMTAFIYYKHPLDPDPTPRVYSRIYQNGDTVGETTVVVDGSPLNIQLKVDGNACLVP